MSTIGLIVPPMNGVVPPDVMKMYPDIRFEVTGIGVRSLSGDGYAEAVGRVAVASRELSKRGVEAILLFGTSLSFFRGSAFNEEIEAVMREEGCVPATTLTSALISALTVLEARRIAVATAYAQDVNDMFRDYFEGEGFEVVRIAGLGIRELSKVDTVPPEEIAALATRIAEDATEAEAVVLSCAGLRTAEIAPRLERKLRRPVISSAMVGGWAALRLAGLNCAVSGFGRLYGVTGANPPSSERTHGS